MIASSNLTLYNLAEMKQFAKVLGERPQGCDGILMSCSDCNYCGLEESYAASQQSNHYEGFGVGAAFKKRYHGGRSLLIARWNLYPNPTSNEKICAEGHAELEFARQEHELGLGKPELTEAAYITAPDLPERNMAINGLALSVLLMCAGCRGYFSVDPSVKGDMPIFAAVYDQNGITAVEKFTYNSMMKLFVPVTPPEVSARPVYGTAAGALLSALAGS